MRLKLDIDREDDGRWIAEAVCLPGVICYGASEREARLNAAALAMRVILDKAQHNEPVPMP